MRAARIALMTVAALLAVLLAGIWVVPGMLDWGRYRDGIASLAAAGIGRPVRITGAVSLSLLPQPVLTAAGIAVDDDGDGVVLTAQELRLRVALGPLLAGRVDARDLVLRGADLRLPWPPGPGALAQRPPAWLSALQARVESSRIQVGALEFAGIDAGLATDPDTGTLSASGLGNIRGGAGADSGTAWRFTARLARPGRDGSAGLDISLDGQGKLLDTGGTFSGIVAGDGSLSGRVAGRGPDLSRLMSAPGVPWRGDGRLSAAAGLAVADELTLSIGGAPARGAVALRVLPNARLDLSLAAGRLDLDAWLPVLARSGAPALPTGVDLSVEAATLAGGTLRRVRGGFDLDAEGVTLHDGQALLPGDATLTLSGRLPRSARAEFTGQARLAAPDLRATLDWLAQKVMPALAMSGPAPSGATPAAPAPAPAVPAGPQPPPLTLSGLSPGVLRTADLSAKLTVGPGQAALSDILGTLDGNGLTGGVGLKLGLRPVLGTALSFDRLVLDAWLPTPAALASPDGLAALIARAEAVDADLHLQIRQATLGGVPLGQVALEAHSEASRLTLRRLEAAPLGAQLTASGTVGEGGRVSDGSLDVAAADLAPLVRLLPPSFPLAPLLRGAGSLSLTLAGPPDALAARLTAVAGGVRLEAQPVLALAARKWDGPVTLHHPGATRLLERFGVPGTAAWLGEGSMSLVAQASASPGTLALSRFSLVAGSLRASGALTLDTRDQLPGIAGQVAAEVLPLPLPYPRGRDPLPVWALQGWQAALQLDAAQVLVGGTPAVEALSADLSLQDGVVRAGRASATLLGGTLSGTAVLDTKADPPQVAVTSDLTGAALAAPLGDGPVGLAGGTLDARLDLHAAGHSTAALLATLAGTAELTAADGTLFGLDLPGAAAALAGPDHAGIATALRLALTQGSTGFTRLALPMRVQRGILTLDGSMAADAGSVGISGTLDLLGATDLRLLVRPKPPEPQETGQPGPEIGVLLTGMWGATRTPELAGLSRWLAERP